MEKKALEILQSAKNINLRETGLWEEVNLHLSDIPLQNISKLI